MEKSFFTRRKWLLLLGVATVICLVLWERPESPISWQPEGSTEYWVWHRSDPLVPAETEELQTQGVKRLLWRSAELALNRDGTIRVRSQVADPGRLAPGFTVVPVFRLTDDDPWLGKESVVDELAGVIRSLAGARAEEVQLDYDCAASQLGDYAHFLRELRERLPGGMRLTVTMLASHGRERGTRQVAKVVDGFYPMFYDLRSDYEEAVRTGSMVAIADVEDTKLWVQGWESTGKPWIAGLPAFARVSAFDTRGRLVGHWRDWSVDELWRSGVREHGQVFSHEEAGLVFWGLNDDAPRLKLGRHALQPGWIVLLRWSTEARVAEMAEVALEQGAVGTAYFRLPGRSGVNLQSLAALGSIGNEKRAPLLVVEPTDDGRIAVVNKGTADLLPRWGEGEEYTFEIAYDEAGAEAPMAGTFLKAERSAVSTSAQTVFSFVYLPCGGKVVTGYLDPERSITSIKWRINDGPWQRF